MFFHDMRAFLAKSIRRLPLDQLIDQVSCLRRPAPGYIIWVNLDLLGQDLVANFFSVFTMVWALAEHALVSDDTHGKVVNSNAMILTAHDLGSHVARRARCVLRIFWVPQTGDTQIGDSEVAVFVEDEVLRLDVTVQDGVLVQVLKAEKHASDEELYRFSNCE